MERTGGSVLWFTGLSGSGKTTTAERLHRQFLDEGRPVELLDGDVIRGVLCKGLGFSRQDRLENIRRIAYVADLLSRHGVTVLVSAITPYQEMRSYLREHVHGYVEVYVKCSLDVCAERDVKGLYAKAMRGEIAMFTGISDVYEEPEQADIVIDTQQHDVEWNARRIVEWLQQRCAVELASNCIAASREMPGHGVAATAESGGWHASYQAGDRGTTAMQNVEARLGPGGMDAREQASDRAMTAGHGASASPGTGGLSTLADTPRRSPVDGEHG
ncbi:adenylyl-sulfate kinase [Paenibacillus xerothermodurans]|uniref:Adenylyl-sulfate kinase n=1 Tax=Paenibacillus xerothermodurans TaxID=1977292 RepID=A0A2W1NCS3_PAEXE|nr:adenylyl-sulfate kinase [Paenibacillus xerothermodurans]